MGRLNHPGKVNHRVCSTKDVAQIVERHIRGGPLRLGKPKLRPPTGDTDNGVDPRISSEQAHETRAHISRRPDDNDPHYR